MLKRANTHALSLGKAQKKTEFKPLLASLLPPEPEYSKPSPDPNKPCHCYELMDDDGRISVDKLIERYGTEHAATFAVFSAFFNLTRDVINADPNLRTAIDCLSSQVEQYAGNTNLDLREQGLIVHDFIPTISLAFMGCFVGITSLIKWLNLLNENPSLRGALCALFPELYAPPYDYRQECIYRMVAMFAGTYHQKDTSNKAAGMQALHAFFLNLRKEQIRKLKPLTTYTFEHGFQAGQFFALTKPQLCLLGFDGQEIKADFLLGEATSRTGSTTDNLLDCSRYIDCCVQIKKNHEAEAFNEMLAVLKQVMPMSNVALVADTQNTTSAIIDTIVASGAYYILTVKRDGVNKPIHIQGLRLLKANQDSEAMHSLLSPECQESDQHEQALVQAIKIERCLPLQLTLDEEQLRAVKGRTIEGTYPSAVSIICYDKTSEEEQANYSKDGLDVLNAHYENNPDFAQRHQLMITNIDVDQPENLEKILCVLNEH